MTHWERSKKYVLFLLVLYSLILQVIQEIKFISASDSRNIVYFCMCSGGSKGEPGSSAPWGPNSFVFTEFFWEIWQNRMLVPPWICHWCDSRNKIYFCKWFKIYSLFLVLIQGMWSISTTDSKNIVYFCHWFKEYSLFLPLIQGI